MKTETRKDPKGEVQNQASTGNSLSSLCHPRKTWFGLGVLVATAALASEGRRLSEPEWADMLRETPVARVDTHVPDRWEIIKNTPHEVKKVAQDIVKEELELAGGIASRVDISKVAGRMRAAVHTQLTHFGEAVASVYQEGDQQLAVERMFVEGFGKLTEKFAPDPISKNGVGIVTNQAKALNRSIDQSFKNAQTRFNGLVTYFGSLPDRDLIDYFATHSSADIATLVFENTRVQGLNPLSREGARTHLPEQIKSAAAMVCDKAVPGPVMKVICKKTVEHGVEYFGKEFNKEATKAHVPDKMAEVQAHSDGSAERCTPSIVRVETLHTESQNFQLSSPEFKIDGAQATMRESTNVSDVHGTIAKESVLQSDKGAAIGTTVIDKDRHKVSEVQIKESGGKVVGCLAIGSDRKVVSCDALSQQDKALLDQGKGVINEGKGLLHRGTQMQPQKLDLRHERSPCPETDATPGAITPGGQKGACPPTGGNCDGPGHESNPGLNAGDFVHEPNDPAHAHDGDIMGA